MIIKRHRQTIREGGARATYSSRGNFAKRVPKGANYGASEGVFLSPWRPLIASDLLPSHPPQHRR